jgi:transcriptional regulator with XRE-family HTH domain
MTRGEMLKTIRQLQKLTPQDLAHASGLSVETIRSYESDELSYVTEEARRLAKALDVPLDVLFYPDNDDVNHPLHYRSHPSGVECIQITEHHNFNVGNAIKYLWRAGLKDNTPSEKDLKKAVWYIQREMKRLEKKSLPR